MFSITVSLYIFSIQNFQHHSGHQTQTVGWQHAAQEMCRGQCNITLSQYNVITYENSYDGLGVLVLIGQSNFGNKSSLSPRDKMESAFNNDVKSILLFFFY